MKKSFAFTAVIAAAALGAAALAACNQTNPPTTLSFSGDLQALYGGENGYPQAVLVGKKSVLTSDEGAVGTLLSYFEGSKTYLESADGATVAGLLSEKYPSGMTPSFDAKNLTSEMISHCSVRFTKSADCKESVNAFLQKLVAVDGEFTKTVEDAFYYTGAPAAADSQATYSVYAPDGAPALSLANAIQASTGNTFEYHIVAANTITAQVTGATPAADFCVLPVNAAAKLLGSGTVYQMLGTVTNGNMYFLGAGKQASLTTKNLASALKGKTIGVVQLANVPGLTLRCVLEANNIPYDILGNDTQASDSSKVHLKAINDAATGVTPAGGCDYYLCPEPAASAKVSAFKK